MLLRIRWIPFPCKLISEPDTTQHVVSTLLSRYHHADQTPLHRFCTFKMRFRISWQSAHHITTLIPPFKLCSSQFSVIRQDSICQVFSSSKLPVDLSFSNVTPFRMWQYWMWGRWTCQNRLVAGAISVLANQSFDTNGARMANLATPPCQLLPWEDRSTSTAFNRWRWVQPCLTT
jgi:hypothetical protein